ncbi:MAG: alpha/beta hydrolase family protein [Actinomycetota bacterium]
MKHRLLIAAGLSAAMVLPTVGHAADEDPTPGSAEWIQRDLENQAYAMQRQVDMATNPAFGHVYWTEAIPEWVEGFGDQLQHPDQPAPTLSRVLPGEAADPYRRHWGGARGIMQPIEYYNDCGARIQGTVFAPKTTARDTVTGDRFTFPLPGIVITTGSIQGYEEMYWWAAQGLAEAGYIVMTYDVMGQGESSSSGSVPGCNTGFDRGTVDALGWFLSDANPMRGLIDEELIGLAGHSAGAFAVTSVGNRPTIQLGGADVPNPVDAVVGWDNISLPTNTAPRVPTMGQAAEYFFNPTPAFTAPNAESKLGTFKRFDEAGVPSYQIVHRGSTHMEWTFVPYILSASRKGERVAMYYTLAWFDRYLKGIASPEHAADGLRRLTAVAFDGSADASSIGAGTWSPEDGNQPNMIEGELASDHLSIYYRSAYSLPDASVSCSNMRTETDC